MTMLGSGAVGHVDLGNKVWPHIYSKTLREVPFLRQQSVAPTFYILKMITLSRQGKAWYKQKALPPKDRCLFSQEKGYLTGLFGKVRTRVFLSAFIIKMLILPRHARDKHTENSYKNTVFL